MRGLSLALIAVVVFIVYALYTLKGMDGFQDATKIANFSFAAIATVLGVLVFGFIGYKLATKPAPAAARSASKERRSSWEFIIPDFFDREREVSSSASRTPKSK